jgi:alkylhydroperoxidase/carboxymuconolactone decarboxylase family protein YurZ
MPAASLSLEDLRAEALAALNGAEEGPGLDEASSALIGLAVRVSVSCLDVDETERFVNRALDAGATASQIHEAMVLVSGLGVHTLMEGSRRLAGILQQRGDSSLTAPLDPNRAALHAKYIGSDPYWESMEREAPGFLGALLRLSPDAFEAFFIYCALPWKSRALRALTKELIAIAVDSSPTHRYLPGFRLHLGNAIGLGAGRKAILQALDIAASAPLHRGVR